MLAIFKKKVNLLQRQGASKKVEVKGMKQMLINTFLLGAFYVSHVCITK